MHVGTGRSVYARVHTAKLTRIQWLLHMTDGETNGQNPAAGVTICPIARYLGTLEQI